MSNIFNNNFHDVQLFINYDEFWDVILDKTSSYNYHFSCKRNEDCLLSLIDVSLYDCVFEDEISSVDNFVWENAVAKGYDLTNIGYTGFDNGLLYFRKDQIMNKDFINLYQNSIFHVNNSTKLILHKVTGSTMTYEYPIEVEDFQIKLNGGFYQGFFKTDCDKYEILPSKLENGDTWAYEFVLKKSNLSSESKNTLNDKYPNNKGLFFYIGTRAENKWDYLYSQYTDDCYSLSPDDYVEDAQINVHDHKINSFLDMSLSMPIEWDKVALNDYVSYEEKNYMDIKPLNEWMHYKIQECCDFSTCEELIDDYIILDDDLINGDSCSYDYIENDIDISDFTYKTTNDFRIGIQENYIDSDNKFLLFHRGCDGINVKTWDNQTLRYIYEKNTFNENLFLLMNRTSTGYTVDNIMEIKQKAKKKYNVYEDLYNNALGFRITDQGEIGYRYLVADCSNMNEPYKIIEGYSKPNIIHEDEWSVIHVQIIGFENTMKLRFYVNGNLVFVSQELEKIRLRKLNEIDEKQETVPYNISIGGGTQGLCDVILPNYMIQPYRTYPLEKHFGGSFIGYFKSFKMYNCNLEYLDIFNNFKYESNNLNLK